MRSGGDQCGYRSEVAHRGNFNPGVYRSSVNKGRFEAFTEGVFAFAFTLLVLAFVLPELRNPTDHTVMAALLHLWPNLVAYVLSLMVIGIMWQNHQALFRMVRRVDRMTIFWNLLLLGGVAFIPFATSTLGNYPTLHSTTFLYGLTLTFTATIYNLMLNHLVATRAFLPEIDKPVIAQTVRAYRTGWVGYVAAMLLALILPVAAFAAYIAVAIYYLVPRGLDADLDREVR
jgi:uncharacterized membrane protein